MPTLYARLRPFQLEFLPAIYDEPSPTFEPSPIYFAVEWSHGEPDPAAPSDAVEIFIHIEEVDHYQTKDEIAKALAQAVSIGEVPWLALQGGKWVVDLDALRNSFELLREYESLTGAKKIIPLFKEALVQRYPAVYHNHLLFQIPLNQDGAATEVREIEQKFQVLCAATQEARDFSKWTDAGKSHDVPVACLFVDIDNFKSLNTKYTEVRIDTSILPGVQRLLERLIRHRGYAYRHGGEEFVVLLPNCVPDEAYQFAEQRCPVAA
ncbi:MAG TPA: diguanylate cyclase [bacterium]|jgi:GGDEF domain-containing protein